MLWIICLGNLADGFEFVGPFGDANLANECADNEYHGREWWVVRLEAPPVDWTMYEYRKGTSHEKA